VSTADEKPVGSAPVHGGITSEEARDAAFSARARELLLDSARHLDAKTRSRLTQARYAALEQLEHSQGRPGFRLGGWLAPAGGLAAVALAGLVWFGATPTLDPVPQSAAVRPDAGGAAVDDLALMADAENLELAEDIEFYSWLETETDLPVTSGGVG
jgi:hypothetical protein